MDKIYTINKVIKGIKYTNILHEEENFLIQYIVDKPKYSNKYRVVNLLGDRDKSHTHLNDVGTCFKCIKLVKGNKIPHTADKYIILSCYRLSIDPDYREEVLDLYYRKKSKQKYYNKR